MVDVRVAPVPWSSHREQLRRVREAVFIVEQQVPREIEWDGEDDTAAHFLAVTADGEAVGCARLLPSGQIGRMAVLPQHRGSGLGRRLLEEAVEEAARQGFSRVHLHAQTHAAEFYRKSGFLPVGGEFMEAGIPHRAMELELPIPFESTGPVAAPLLRQQPAAADVAATGVQRHRGEADCRLALLRCLELPRRSLAILSQQLDHALFDQQPLVDAVSRFARSSPSAEVRVLIAEVGPIVSRGHRLVELARRLDSRIAIRRLPAEAGAGEESFVTWDERGMFLLPDFRDYTALLDPNDPVQARRLQETFDRLWSRSQPDPELRTLGL